MSQFNILVIDNSPTQRAVVMAYLKNRGYSASHASTHREALKLLNQKAIHLITLDWDMPDEKPLAFVQTLRNGWKHFDIPIVMMTEYNQSEEVIKGMNAGCDDYVTKTDGIELLEIRIRRLLAFHQLRDSNRFQKCQPHILLIDDCKTFLATTSRFLEEKQLRVTIADSGSKGLQTLESESIDLILVDQVMPEMRGLEFIQQVRKNDSYRDIPIIMLVVKGVTDDIVSAISIGGIDDFLNKDTDLNLLENKIATLLRKNEESRQNNRQLIQEVKKNEQLLKTATHELQEMRTQFIQAEKMSSFGQMVAGITHEINNPLSFVLNNLHIIKTDFTEIGDVLHKYQAGVGNPAEIKNDIQILQGLEELTDVIQTSYDGIKRIQEIILNMRNFARLDNKRTYFNLYEGIESALMILHHKLKNRITVEKKFHPIPETYCVCGQLIQVFMNLLNNAADAIIDQGVITIEGFEQNQQIILLFSDTGSGIPSENIDRLFEPFFTTKDKGHGLGLGLSIVHSIITNHKGTITVDSEPKKTTFRIALPVDSGAGSG